MRALWLLLTLAACGGGEDINEASCLAHPRAECALQWPGGYAICDDNDHCIVMPWPNGE